MPAKLIGVRASANLIGSIKNTFNFRIGLRKTRLPADSQRVVDRFQQLLDGHLLNRMHLLQMVPRSWQWNLKIVSDINCLLEALTPDKLDWMAEKFGVRHEWLSGSGDCIYHWPYGYKHPQDFVAFLRDNNWINDELRLTIFSDNYKRGTNGSLNQFVLVFSQPLTTFDNGEHTIYRHVVFEDLMTWNHPTCRINAKVVGRWFHRIGNPHGPIPIVPVISAKVKSIAEGCAFPGQYIPWGLGAYDQFQDRVLTPSEFPLAIEAHEIETVLHYFALSGL